MKVLWITNFIPTLIAGELGLPVNNKEGWIAGVMGALLKDGVCIDGGEEIKLSVAAPVTGDFDEGFIGTYSGIDFYGFIEDPQGVIYDEDLEKVLVDIAYLVKPDIIHIFGTEYPHTRAMLEGINKCPRKDVVSLNRVLIGMQGVVGEIAYHYFDGLPEKITNRNTFRDIVRKDGLQAQKNKFMLRATNEMMALSLAKNVTGRTPFDKKYVSKWAKGADYYHLNETLRPEFYEGYWQPEDAVCHSIFLSQANYPIKGMHNVLKALPKILAKYPDTTIRVAGDSITKHAGIKDRLKLSGYGKYLLKLEKEVAKETGKSPSIEYLGSLTAAMMKQEYLRASLFICPSTNENSPNSLGEAMLLGVPCIASNVGGIPGMMSDGVEGLFFEALSADELFECVDKLWSDTVVRDMLREAASKRARETHDPDKNIAGLLEIYKEIKSKPME